METETAHSFVPQGRQTVAGPVPTSDLTSPGKNSNRLGHAKYNGIATACLANGGPRFRDCRLEVHKMNLPGFTAAASVDSRFSKAGQYPHVELRMSAGTRVHPAFDW